MNRFLHHICIQTNKYSESLYFYKQILGLKLVKETANFHGREYNTWLRHDSFLIELQTPKAGETFQKCDRNQEGIVHICFCVDDIQSEYQKLKHSECVRFMSKGSEDIYEVEGGKLFKFVAPEGTIIEIRDNKDIN